MHLPTWASALDATRSAPSTLGVHAARLGHGWYWSSPGSLVSFAMPPRWDR